MRKKQTNMMYPKYSDFRIWLGSFTYKGVQVRTCWAVNTRPDFGADYQHGMVYGHKQYWQNGIGTANLLSVLDSIDYNQSQVPRLSDELRAKPVGYTTAFGEYVKTNFQGEHEDPNVFSWFVKCYSGKVIHYSALAAEILGYKSRSDRKQK